MITYYSDIKDLQSVHNPLSDNGAVMRHSGYFETVKNDQTPYFGTSLKKTLHGQGRIFCDDASKLFSISEGYVNLILSFPVMIHKGVLGKARFSDNEYMLWGVNMGQTDIETPGIGVFFTKNGIEFRVSTSGGTYSLIENSITVFAEKFFEIEFLWDNSGIQDIPGIDEEPTMLIRFNKENTLGGVIPIVDDGNINSNFYSDIGQTAPASIDVFEDVQFQLFDNLFKLNNLPCSISRIAIEDSIPSYI